MFVGGVALSSPFGSPLFCFTFGGSCSLLFRVAVPASDSTRWSLAPCRVISRTLSVHTCHTFTRRCAVCLRGRPVGHPCVHRRPGVRFLEMVPRPVVGYSCSPVRSPGLISNASSALCRKPRGRSLVSEAMPQTPNRLGGDPTPSQFLGRSDDQDSPSLPSLATWFGLGCKYLGPGSTGLLDPEGKYICLKR